MLYAAMAFWLFVIVLTAWGVHHIWSGLLNPRTVNLILLPGTFVRQIGYVIGVLISGGTINDTTVIKDDETAEPAQADNPQSRVPLLGPILIGMLPLATCGVALYFVANLLGKSIVRTLGADHLSQTLPRSLAGAWQLLRDMISVAQDAVDAVRYADLLSLSTVAFVYLVICLTVRMAPFKGNLRGTIGAIVLVGGATGVISMITPRMDDIVHGGWAVLSLAVAVLVTMLLLSLLIRGIVELIRILAQQG